MMGILGTRTCNVHIDICSMYVYKIKYKCVYIYIHYVSILLYLSHMACKHVYVYNIDFYTSYTTSYIPNRLTRELEMMDIQKYKLSFAGIYFQILCLNSQGVARLGNHDSAKGSVEIGEDAVKLLAHRCLFTFLITIPSWKGRFIVDRTSLLHKEWIMRNNVQHKCNINKV